MIYLGLGFRARMGVKTHKVSRLNVYICALRVGRKIGLTGKSCMHCRGNSGPALTYRDLPKPCLPCASVRVETLSTL